MLPSEQLLQRGMWRGAADDDLVVLRIDFYLLPVMQADLARDLGRDPNREILAPAPDRDFRRGFLDLGYSKDIPGGLAWVLCQGATTAVASGSPPSGP